jgi:hypothetical protein
MIDCHECYVPISKIKSSDAMKRLLSCQTVLTGVGIVLMPLVLGVVLPLFLLVVMIGTANDIRQALKTKLS